MVAVGCIMILLCFMLFSCTEDIPNPLTEEDVRKRLKSVTIKPDGNGDINDNGNGNGTTLPDSGKIVFIAQDDNGSWIYLINPDGTEKQLLTDDFMLAMSAYSPSWSPDGKVVFFSFVSNAFEVLNLDGTKHSQLSPDMGEQVMSYDYHISWSINGTIAFSITDANFFSSDIYTVDSNGANMTRITASPEFSFSFYPSWSPYGTELAFAFEDANGWSYIYTVDAGGMNIIQLTFDGEDMDPAWSPDGTKIAFTSDRDFDYEIYSMNSDGSNHVNLTNNPERDDMTPTWSPDGRWIAFASEDYDLGSDIYVMDSNGSNQTNITNSPGVDDIMPAWSP